VAGSCEHGNEASGSIKGGEFLDYLSDYQFLRKDCVKCSYLVWWYRDTNRGWVTTFYPQYSSTVYHCSLQFQYSAALRRDMIPQSCESVHRLLSLKCHLEITLPSSDNRTFCGIHRIYCYALCWKAVWRRSVEWDLPVLGEWRYSSTRALTSAQDGSEWSASHPSRFSPKERSPGTHWIGGWVGPRAVLDAVVKRKIPSPRREAKPRTPVVQPVVQRYTDWDITALTSVTIKGEKLELLTVWSMLDCVRQF
jgi:hypothetical protein